MFKRLWQTLKTVFTTDPASYVYDEANLKARRLALSLAVVS